SRRRRRPKAVERINMLQTIHAATSPDKRLWPVSGASPLPVAPEGTRSSQIFRCIHVEQLVRLAGGQSNGFGAQRLSQPLERIGHFVQLVCHNGQRLAAKQKERETHPLVRLHKQRGGLGFRLAEERFQ